MRASVKQELKCVFGSLRQKSQSFRDKSLWMSEFNSTICHQLMSIIHISNKTGDQTCIVISEPRTSNSDQWEFSLPNMGIKHKLRCDQEVTTTSCERKNLEKKLYAAFRFITSWICLWMKSKSVRFFHLAIDTMNGSQNVQSSQQYIQMQIYRR